MNITQQFQNKRILIWGYGREGKSTELFLRNYCEPASVSVFEGKREEIDESAYDCIFKSPGIVMKDDNPKYTSQTQVFLEAFRDQVIGITGTKGKSTTSSLLAQTLRETTGRPVLLLGNIGLPCLDYYGEIQPSTLIVFEMSCHQLAHTTVSPHVAVFLNLFEEHLDYYGTMDAYFTAKSHVVSYQKSGDFAFLGENVPFIASESMQRVITHQPQLDVNLKLFGTHNQLNAQFVRTIAQDVYGADPEAVTRSMEAFEGLPHRMQRVGVFGNVEWYDDSISTIPEAAIQAAESIPRVGTLLIGGMDRGIQYGILEDFMQTHPQYRFICMYASGKRIVEELGDAAKALSNLYVCEDLREAVNLAAKITPSGFACVLSPAAPSYGYFKNFEERGDVFVALARSHSNKLSDYLQGCKILADGSFGTYYSEKYDTSELPELANLLHPERVKQIHTEYLEAGASLLRTNTFAANTKAMGEDWDRVASHIQAAISIAQDAVSRFTEKQQIFLAGDIGPIPVDYVGGGEEEAICEYNRIVDLFLQADVRILIFETFQECRKLIPVLERAKKVAQEQGKDIFTILQFSVNQFGYSGNGLSARKLLQDAASLSCVDGVGLNCGIGPFHMQQILKRISLPEGKWLSAMPNAGYPARDRSQIMEAHAGTYFADKMQELLLIGCDILGGCCGTNPVMLKAVHEKAKLSQFPRKVEIPDIESQKKEVRHTGFLYEKDGSRKQKKLIAVELVPPFDANDETLMEAAHLLERQKVDVLTFPDSPSGRTRVDSVLMAEKVRRETGMTVMPHICCRDKNAIAMRSLFLGAQINQINNALIITGDPIPSMERQKNKSVFQFDSVGLMQIVSEMNEDVFSEMPFCYGGAINQGRKNLEVEISRVQKKMASGAEFFMTQPVFTKEDADRIRRIKEETGAVILCGIMPLISRKNALFMKNEISGVNVTEEIVSRYPEQPDRVAGEAVGVALAREMMAMTADFADGYYFTFPFNRIYLLEEIMK